jgi:hypothetical protein
MRDLIVEKHSLQDLVCRGKKNLHAQNSMGILTAAENKQTNNQTDKTRLFQTLKNVWEMRRTECLNGETKEFMRETQKEMCEEEPSKELLRNKKNVWWRNHQKNLWETRKHVWWRTFKRISEKQRANVWRTSFKRISEKQKAISEEPPSKGFLRNRKHVWRTTFKRMNLWGTKKKCLKTHQKNEFLRNRKRCLKKHNKEWVSEKQKEMSEEP